MSRRELTTAAADIQILDRPNAAEIKKLQQDFNLHPLDVEAILAGPKESSCDSYREYVRLVLVWPEVIRDRIKVVSTTWLLQPEKLAIVSLNASPIVSGIIQTWTEHQYTNTRGPAELLSEILLAVIHGIEALPLPVDSQKVMSDFTVAIKALPAALKKLTLLPAGSEQHYLLLGHLAGYKTEQLAKQSPFTSKQAQARIPALGRLISGYTAVSAALVVLAILATKQ